MESILEACSVYSGLVGELSCGIMNSAAGKSGTSFMIFGHL